MPLLKEQPISWFSIFNQRHKINLDEGKKKKREREAGKIPSGGLKGQVGQAARRKKGSQDWEMGKC